MALYNDGFWYHRLYRCAGGFGTDIICLYRAMVYKFSIFGLDL